MRVKTLESTDDAEKLMCVAARGDYMSDWNAENTFEEIMSGVDYDDRHYESAVENNYYPDEKPQTEARMMAFIEKQLSRGHFGPAEHPQITFAVEGVSRVTMAQITRHRHMTFDIQSMRYADFSGQKIKTPKSLTDDDHFSRETGVTELTEDREDLERLYNRAIKNSLTTYQSLVNAGVPKEDARFALPLGTTVNMTFSGNARTFLHLLDMRRKADAQWEIRELSEALLEELFDWMPYTFNYYADHGPNKLSP